VRTRPGRVVRVYWSATAAPVAGQYMVEYVTVGWLAVAWGVRGHYEEVAAAVYLALGTAFVTLRWHTVCRVRIRSPRGTDR
jgi:hypothetical protein